MRASKQTRIEDWADIIRQMTIDFAKVSSMRAFVDSVTIEGVGLVGPDEAGMQQPLAGRKRTEGKFATPEREAWAGVLGSVAGTFGGYEFRTQLVRATGGKDLPIALLEDAIAIGGAILIVSWFS